MSRNFPGAANEDISLGDITTARFKDLDAWSILAFFRIENSASDDRGIVTKWAGGSETHFLLRTDAQTAPSNILMHINNGLRITGGDNIALNTWYLVGVTNSGGGGATDLTLYLVDMDGTFLDDGITGDHAGDAPGLLVPIRIGGRLNNDNMNGDIAYVCYVDAAVTKAEVLAYRYDPIKMAKIFEAVHGVQFFIPLLGLDSPEPDWSRNNITATLSGTIIRNNMPPVALFTPRWASVPLIEEVAGGADVRNHIIPAYMRING